MELSRDNYVKVVKALKKDLVKKGFEEELVEVFVDSSLKYSKVESFSEKFPFKYLNRVIEDSIKFLLEKRDDIKLELEDIQIENKNYTQIKLLTDNNPFIVDSITSIINNLNEFYIDFSIQPIFVIERAKSGKLTKIEFPHESGNKELYLLFLLDAISDIQKDKLRKDIVNSVEEGRLAVSDFKDMEKRVKDIARKLNDPIYLKKISEKDTEDIKEFLMWLLDENFIFLGMRTYRLDYEEDDILIQMDKPSCLGILRKIERSMFKDKISIKELPESALDTVKAGNVLVIDKTNSKSNVYDTRRMDYIAISEFDKDLKVIKRHIILGLFTSKALKEQASNIPFLKSKLDRILFEENVVEDSFEYKHMIDIFNTLTKDDLFISSTENLKILLEELLTCETEKRIKILTRQANLVHGVYLIAVLPVKFYSQKNIENFTQFLSETLKTEDIEYKIITQSPRIIRIHYYLIFDKYKKPKIDVEVVEENLKEIVSSWKDNFRSALADMYGSGKASYYINKYMNSFDDEYISKTSPDEAIFDIEHFEKILTSQEVEADIYTQGDSIFFNIYSLNKLPLYEILPKLNNMGLNVLYEDFVSIEINKKIVYIQRFSVDPAKLDLTNADKLFKTINENFEAIWRGIVEDDGLNELTTKAVMGYKYIDVLRTLSNYLMQINFQIKKASIISVLVKYPHLASMLIDYFENKFSPQLASEEEVKKVYEKTKNELEQINDIHEYRIVHSLFNIIESTVRTNFYKRNKKYHYISLKINSSKILTMPSPRPMFEVYVHSSFMEGCHLRGGKVARGGIRWSDRKDDFRLEILGLMKTQMVKNAVIVPVGSKGGFIVKAVAKNREEWIELGKKAYRTLMRGMLDVTDNIDENNNEIRPEDVVCYDEFDPYLVVAADKGTATFSDIANEISEKEYNFWLKDAFASGGKHGYDHKKIGITARGAWQCVERHFREMGKNVFTDTFTVVGIGDMSGDVFGNGMLYTDKIILKAAFNHIEIFIDPNPDPEASYKERKRLFDNGLTWKYYDKKLLSKGGFVVDRNAKSIKLTKEAKEFLQTNKNEVSGEDLIKLILQADVDLLWNGGIGTYVKATDETNEDVGDRLNDAVRIDASQLRAKIVGEGGNLGLTQKARIEYALRGGKLNTDALDNSAGVDMSDHEVNLKILLGQLMKDGVLKDLEARNKMLEDLTEEVTQRVLTHNYMQSFAVSLDEMRSKQEPDIFFELDNFLKNKGVLHKEDYPFPDRKELSLRVSRGVGYTRPELSVMLALNKMFVYNELLKSQVFSGDTIDQYAIMYFPPTIRAKYQDYIVKHRLKNEIAFTFMVNLIINNNGATSLLKIHMMTDQHIPQIMKSMIFSYDVLDILNLRNELFEYENKIPQQEIYKISLDMFDAVNSFTINEIYMFRDGVSLDTKKEEEIKGWLNDYYSTCVEEGLYHESYLKKVDDLKSVVDETLAKKIARLYFIEPFIPSYHIARLLGKDIKTTVEALDTIDRSFGFKELKGYINSIHIANEWDRMAQFSVIRNYILAEITMAIRLIKEFAGDINAMIESKREVYDEYKTDLDTIMGIKSINLHPAMLLYDKLQKLLH
ncbi:NAD-glutamate dehydrogenase [Hippea maritima]|uniref:NAD-glutamate dehydrogenase n=1 Tax=Hippea maritima (strain ATCC 700847 / DSM 10411 / MH2) TaxID=760142 RepID=F2LXK8_HIPMA|nr:NAD-glutamate dehydrogenase [Hippea maritima]AEA33194.1 NAD-glutamate dehydrogenase [Hippea maritima DSM 10411]